MTFTLNGSFVDQTGTNTSLSGIEALAGVTLISGLGALDIYDMGSLQLRVDGDLTINGNDSADREMLVVGNGATDATVDVHVRTGGVLTIGARAAQSGIEFSTDQYFPSLYEKDNLSFSNSSGKATSGQSILGSATSKSFLVVDGGGQLNWYGCINFTGGGGFDGVGNQDSTPVPTTNAIIRVKDGVMDTRRVAARSGTDNFIYMYSNDVEIDGLIMVNSDVTTSGIGFIIAEPPKVLRGVQPVFCEAPFGGSTTVPRDMVLTIENYPGNFGLTTQQDGNFVCQQTIGNSETITYLDSSKGSNLVLSPTGGFTQTYAAAIVDARQTVRATAVTAQGAPISDAILVTQNKSRDVFSSTSAATAAVGLLDLPDQPINNAVMTLDAKIYTFQTTLTNVDGNIEIGASLAVTKTNIENAINLTGTPGTGYAASMTIHPTITISSFSGDIATLTAKSTGPAGNDIDLFRGFYIPSGTSGTGSLNNIFDFNKMGTSIGGSDEGSYNLGRLLLTRFVKDGDGIVGSHMLPRHGNPSGRGDDLWSFYLYSFLYLPRNRLDVLLRTIDGRDLEFINSIDLGVTDAKITVDAYTDCRDMGRLYDATKVLKLENPELPVVEADIITASGQTLDAGEYDVRIDGDSAGGFPITLSHVIADRDQIAQGLTWAESATATIAAGDDRLLVVAVGNDTDPIRVVTGITYGGVGMELLGKRSGPTTRLDTSEVGIEVWALREDGIAAAVGTSIVVSWDVAPTNTKTYRASFTGVSQIAPRMAIDSDYSADVSPTSESALQTNPIAEGNGVVLCFAANQSAGAVTFEGALTERLDTTTSGFGFAVADVFPTVDGAQSADVTSTENVVLSISLRPRQGLMTVFTSQDPVVTLIGSSEAVSVGVDDEITISFPAGIMDDDVAYIAVGHSQSAANTWNTPAGWVIPTGLTEVQTGAATSRPGVSVFRRVLSSDSGSVTITNAGVNTSGIVAQMLVYRGVDTTTPEDVNPTTASNTTGDPDPASITPVNPNSMILTFGFMDDGQQDVPTPPAGYTAILDTQTPDGAGTGE